MTPCVTVIGGGLAGCAAAFAARSLGVPVVLREMRPARPSPVHDGGALSYLVCSNSLGSNRPETAPGLLKAEMRALGVRSLEIAESVAVPAGQALAVDRDLFAERVEAALAADPGILIVRGEVRAWPHSESSDAADAGATVIATGPVTSPEFEAAIRARFDLDLYFFDAVAPIVSADSLDRTRIYEASRNDRGTPDYLNAPMNKEEYLAFHAALLAAEVVPVSEMDRLIFFESCLPVEELARRGVDTLCFGPMKPVGLRDPAHPEAKRAHAVVQLRRENAAGDCYNLVGFQTRLKFGEQKRVFSMIPGMENAEFLRYGVMHKNLYVYSPGVLDPDLSVRGEAGTFLAGQLIGIEGYTEAIATGHLAGLNAARRILGKPPLVLPRETVLGALVGYITDPATPKKSFQPMNVNFGLLPPPPRKKDKRAHREAYHVRSTELVRRTLLAPA